MNSDIFTKNGRYLMLALDQRGSFRKLLNPNNPDSTDKAQAIQIKGEIISAVYNQFSGVLFDYDYGLPAYRMVENFKKPFLLPAEKTGYTNEEGERVTELNKSANVIKNDGASGVKLLVYYNPGSSTSEKQLETTKKVLEETHAQNLPLFLEIVNYGIESQVAATVQDFLDHDINADVFKLEYPGSPTECEKVSNILQKTPWIILTKGVSFDEFTPKLTDAINAGCSGFLAGRALWQEYLGLHDDYEKDKFLRHTLPYRFGIIANIALKG